MFGKKLVVLVFGFHPHKKARLGINFEEYKGSTTSINELYERCMNLTPPPTKDVIAKIVGRLFQVEPKMHFQCGERFVVYKNLRSREYNNQNMCFPPFCKVAEQSSCRLQIECPLTTMINGKLETCSVTLTDSDTLLFVPGQHIKCGYSVPLVQMTLDGIIHALHCIRICKGVPYADKLPKTFEKETISTMPNENSFRSIGRSKSCKKLIPLCGKTDTCKTCTDSYNQYTRRADKLVMTETFDQPKISEEVPAKQPRVPLCDSTNITPTIKTNPKPTRTQSDVIINPSLDLNNESHADMKSILGDILKDGNAGEFRTLLESQLRNCSNELDVHQRRWDPKVISICLGILLRSPQAYQNLKDSGLLVLPSRRLLQYYKNIIKQHPGFNAQNLDWMKQEATRKNISKFGHHGGILIDEMTIQDDLVICKTGDTWSIVGMVDMGETNNAIKVLTNGKRKVEMATHALQFVFHGFTGFRWPVVYFGSSTATAHELYTTFWDCVDKLDEHGFCVDYVMLDGASTNRSFTNMLMKEPREAKFIFKDVFDHTHSICAIQDIMHCLKKVRNNIESSTLDHSSQNGRYLIVNGVPVVWDHWRECFNINFQSGFAIHRKLTDEHINLTPASKMRNHLAIQVLDNDMLYLMKMYQSTLKDPERLSSSVLFLEKTSQLTLIFSDKNRPISTLTDERLTVLKDVLNFFNTWESDIVLSTTYTDKKNLMTQQTRDDINSSITGFISLCNLHVRNGNSVNPGYLNSDLVENLFCQQRGIRNGLNTNPTLAQYGPSKTAIILGQHSVSNKANSGTAAVLYNAHRPFPLNPQRNKVNKLKRRSIRI